MNEKSTNMELQIFKTTSCSLLKIIYQTKVINKQAIPKQGPIIIAGNHKAYPDPVLDGSCTKRIIHIFIKDVYTNSPLGPFFRSCRSISSTCWKTTQRVI